jgi:Putative prokaryotic signal transducing protein
MTKDLERTKREPRADEPMVPVFSSSNYNAETEAAIIHGVLESNGIPSIVAGSHVLPNLEIQVQVPERLLDHARELIREAKQDGRRSADEAEAATEE